MKSMTKDVLLDGVVKKLKRGSTGASADEYDKDVKTALFLLEEALRKMET